MAEPTTIYDTFSRQELIKQIIKRDERIADLLGRSLDDYVRNMIASAIDQLNLTSS